MKRFLFLSFVFFNLIPCLAYSVVSINVGEPGFFGRIDIGDLPTPKIIYPEPVIIQQVPAVIAPQPIYLHVPPGHVKHWSKHCYKYNACGRPVYFVKEDWYERVYVPYYRDHYDKEEWKHREKRWKHEEKKWKHHEKKWKHKHGD